MQKDIKITMLGATETGKTCYMLAMYNLMREGINGFTLAHQDFDEDLALADRWDVLEYEHQWPGPTRRGESTSYKFDFCFAYDPLISFDWLDYGGAALTNPQKEDSVSSEELKQIIQRLTESSCIFLCVSGENLQEHKIDRENKAILARMNVFFREIVKQGKKPSVVILITKYDLCAHRTSEDIFQNISRFFSPFFAEGGNWDVMVCPVTLGLDLGKDKENGAIKPDQVHLPLMFAIFQNYYASTIYKEGEKIQWSEKFQKAQKASETLASDDPDFWGKLRKWWNRDRSAETALRKTEEELERSKEELERSKRELFEDNTKLQLLFNQLKDQTGFLIYSNGRRQESADD